MKLNLAWSGVIFNAASAAKSRQSCPTLCDPIDGSPPCFPVPGILQARTLEWVAISFSNAWKWKVNVKSLNRIRLLATPWTVAHQAPLSVGFCRQEYWSGVPVPSLMGYLLFLKPLFLPLKMGLILLAFSLLLRIAMWIKFQAQGVGLLRAVALIAVEEDTLGFHDSSIEAQTGIPHKSWSHHPFRVSTLQVCAVSIYSRLISKPVFFFTTLT